MGHLKRRYIVTIDFFPSKRETICLSQCKR